MNRLKRWWIDRRLAKAEAMDPGPESGLYEGIVTYRLHAKDERMRQHHISLTDVRYVLGTGEAGKISKKENSVVVMGLDGAGRMICVVVDAKLWLRTDGIPPRADVKTVYWDGANLEDPSKDTAARRVVWVPSSRIGAVIDAIPDIEATSGAEIRLGRWGGKKQANKEVIVVSPIRPCLDEAVAAVKAIKKETS